jgi:hypothetical protein
MDYLSLFFVRDLAGQNESYALVPSPRQVQNFLREVWELSIFDAKSARPPRHH